MICHLKRRTAACSFLSLLLAMGAAYSQVSAVRANDRVVLENKLIRVVLSEESDWSIDQIVHKIRPGRNLVRQVKAFSFLRPDASEVTNEIVGVSLENGVKQASVVVDREGEYFRVQERITVSAAGRTINLAFSLRIKRGIRIGVLRLPILRASYLLDYCTYPEDGEVVVADTACKVKPSRTYYDNWFGLLDSKTKDGLLLVVKRNRADALGNFVFFDKRPGFLKCYFDYKTGAFGEVQTVRASQTWTFAYQIVVFSGDVEAAVNSALPGSLTERATKSLVDRNLLVFLEPTFYRDDGFAYFLGKMINNPRFLLYAKKQPFNTKGMKLCLDLPKEVALVRAVLFNYWTRKHVEETPPREEVVHEGKPYVRHFLTCPDEIKSRAAPNIYNCLRWHQIFTYVHVPKRDLLPEFMFYWRLKHPQGDGRLHRAPAKVIKAPYDTPNPRRFELWGGLDRKMRWASEDDLAAYVRLLKQIGVTAVHRVGTSKYVKALLPDINHRLAQAGFEIVQESFVGHLRTAAIRRLQRSDPESFRVALNGKRDVDYAGNNPQDSLCPSYLLRPDSPVSQEMRDYFKRILADGATIFWADLECKAFEGCYCETCLKAFAEHAGLSYEEIKALPPKELIRRYPKEWYFFRNWQTGEMMRQYRTTLRGLAPGKNIRVGFDFNYHFYLDKVLPGLGHGVSMFAEDPRLMKNAEADFVCLDALHSGLFSYDRQQVVGAEVEGVPIIPKAIGIGGLYFEPGCYVSRRMLADFRALKLGIDRWAQLMRMSIIAYAANGASGAIVHHLPQDAHYFTELDKAAFHLSVLEDYYFDGERINDSLRVQDISTKCAPREIEKSLAASWIYSGAKWGQLVRHTAHRLGKHILVTVFNFDLVQPRAVMVGFQGLKDGHYALCDPITGMGFLSPKGDRSWDARELAAGVPLQAASLDVGYMLCCAGPKPPTAIAQWQLVATEAVANWTGFLPVQPQSKPEPGNYRDMIEWGITAFEGKQ